MLLVITILKLIKYFFTAVTPGLAGLSLSAGGTPSMVPGISKPSVDYSRYVKRYSSALECGSHTCRELNHR